MGGAVPKVGVVLKCGRCDRVLGEIFTMPMHLAPCSTDDPTSCDCATLDSSTVVGGTMPAGSFGANSGNRTRRSNVQYSPGRDSQPHRWVCPCGAVWHLAEADLPTDAEGELVLR
jgi:hypothetical protein